MPFCLARQSPSKPCSGNKLMLHLPFEVRVRVAIMAIANDNNLNLRIILAMTNARWLMETIMPSMG